MSVDREKQGRRVTSSLIILGLVFGVVLAVQPRPVMQASPSPPASVAATEKIHLVEIIKAVVFWLLVLMGILAISTFAFLRWSRGYRRWLLRRPRPPTAADDVWSMHRLPDESKLDEPP